MVSVENISMEFSARPILNDITFLINKRDRVALIGKNGSVIHHRDQNAHNMKFRVHLTLHTTDGL